MQTIPRGNGFLVLAAGVDARSLLYAAGEILRHTFHAPRGKQPTLLHIPLELGGLLDDNPLT